MSKNRQHEKIKSPILDVVITTAGRFDMLAKCLDVLYKEAQETPLTITISDIDSPKEERSQNQHLYQYDLTKDPNHNVVRFRVKQFNTNVGFPAGANGGAKLGTAPLLMIINDDVELQAGAIQEIVSNFKDESVGIVGIKLLFPNNSTRPGYPAGKVQHVGLALNIRGEPVHPLVGWSSDNPKCNVSRDVWAVTGACFTIRRKFYNIMKGFDEIYGRGTWEDADLCMKVRSLGHRVYLTTKTFGYHYTGASQEKRKEGFPLQQNMLIFQSRWRDAGYMIYDEFSYL